jgi:hypothetical protein
MNKKKGTFITLLVVAAISFLAAIYSFARVYNLKLYQTTVTTEEVKDAFITEHLVGGFRYKWPETIFCFRLYNVNQTFAIHLPGNAYGDLERSIKKGDSVRVYYDPSTSRFNTDVYQVETKTQVVYSFETYKEKASDKAGYMFILGIVLLAIAFFGYSRFNIFTFLLKLAQVSQHKSNDLSIKGDHTATPSNAEP